MGGHPEEVGRVTLCDALPLLLTAPSQRASLALPAPSPAHRLDARVGGVIAVAKTRRALAGLSTLFRERRVTKVYVAIVVGAVCIEELAGDRIDAGGRFTCTAISESEATSKSPEGGLRVEQQGEDGRLSVTEVRVLEVTPCAVHGALTTLELRPLTGRRHQLRIACALALGAPIVGDDLYSKRGAGREDAPRQRAAAAACAEEGRALLAGARDLAPAPGHGADPPRASAGDAALREAPRARRLGRRIHGRGVGALAKQRDVKATPQDLDARAYNKTRKSRVLRCVCNTSVSVCTCVRISARKIKYKPR